jgi:hypothetical protein
MEVQSNNRSTNFLVEYKGETKTLKNWTRELGLEENYSTIYNRIHRLKWSIEKAFETPIRNKKSNNYGKAETENETQTKAETQN